MEMILKESFGLCPYLRTMQKEKKRSILIRDEEKELRKADECEEPAIRKMKEKIRCRTDRTMKNRWASLATECIREIEESSESEKEAIRRYRAAARDGIDGLGRRKKEGHGWVRTTKLVLNEEMKT